MGCGFGCFRVLVSRLRVDGHGVYGSNVGT